MINKTNILRYDTNMFAFPAGYFEQHMPEELHISEEDRQELIRLQSEQNTKSYEERVDEWKKSFEQEFFE